MLAVQPDGEHIVVMAHKPRGRVLGDFGPALVDEKALEAAARAEGAGVVVVSRASRPRRRIAGNTPGDTGTSSTRRWGSWSAAAAKAEADRGQNHAPPPPPPAPAGERRTVTWEVTADVVVAVNVPDGRL